MGAADINWASTQTSFPASFRSMARDLAIEALAKSGRIRIARRNATAEGDTAVLMLHRVVPDHELARCRSPKGMVLRESLFASLLDHLSNYAEILSPLDMTGGPRKSGRTRVLLTFDDGWIDNFDVALRHLNHHRIKACFFVVTSYAGREQPFWPERMLGLLRLVRASGKEAPYVRLMERLGKTASSKLSPSAGLSNEGRLLTWMKQFPPELLFPEIDFTLDAIRASGEVAEEVRDPRERLMDRTHWKALSAEGHRIASHTCTHALLPQVPPQQMMRELRDSRQDIEETIGDQHNGGAWIAYPNGATSTDVGAAASEAGYTHGFINTPSLWREDTPLLFIPRINIWDGTLTDHNGNFSPNHLDYSMYWRIHHGPVRQ
jgi:peptidoglycan/xylan/chitin deacetylase (PgdA/CDA1 family)